MASPVPNLPPTAGVQDPAARAFLDALQQAWTVRNGQTRETDEKFLTLSDLKDGFALAAQGGVANPLGNGSSPNLTASAIANLIGHLSAEIMQSKLYKRLGERLDVIERPEWLERGNAAGVNTEVMQLTSEVKSVARQVTMTAADFNNNLAITRDVIESVSDAAGATAVRLSELQTTVGDVTTTAEEAFRLAQSVDGNLDGYWGVKFDANGYVAAFGMSLDGTVSAPTSSFGVRADRFFIGPPDGQASYAGTDFALPFIVTTTTVTIDGKTYPPGVWINVARIANATIGSAQIADASIDSLKVAGNAITIPLHYVLAVSVPGSGAHQVVASLPVTAPAGVGVKVVGMFTARVGYSAGAKQTGYKVTATIGGVESTLVDFGYLSAAQDFPSFQFYHSLSAGQTATYKVYFYGQDTTVALGYCSMTLLGGKAVKHYTLLRDGVVVGSGSCQPGNESLVEDFGLDLVWSDAPTDALIESTLPAQVEALSRRAALLQQSDWTQLPDVPAATRAAWAPYRQALRDITLQPGWPDAVVWPAVPPELALVAGFSIGA